MAVTQQFARLSAEELAECRSSVEALDAVCSFAGPLVETDYLDLDWYPAPLLEAAEHGGTEPALLDALRLAFEGQVEVNPYYRDVPDSVFEHPVNALAPAEVAQVSERLDRLSGDGFPLTERGVAGLSGAFQALVAFYAEAARRKLGIVMWWD